MSEEEKTVEGEQPKEESGSTTGELLQEKDRLISKGLLT